MYKNIFYFKRICKIGGTEQFLYEIAKKYHDIDITIFYDDADSSQLKRLRKYLRCKKRVAGQKIECEKAFYNFNIDIINDVEAKEHIFVSHAIYQVLGYKPPINHPKLTRWIGVSKYSADKIEEYAKLLGLDIKAEVCYNPLTLEPKEDVIKLVSATRLDDKTKGGELTYMLIEALDRASVRLGKHYMWVFFTNTTINSESLNITSMKPRVDVRPYIANADYLVQLSKNMETYCYSINEALSYGVPVVTTPLTITKEIGLNEDMQIIMDWNGSNVDEVAEKILTRKKKEFNYIPPADNWINLLAEGKSTYKEELKMKYKVRATSKYQETNTSDNELSINERVVPEEGREWITDKERADMLEDKGFVTIVEAIKEEKEEKKEVKQENKEVVEAPIEEKPKKTTRKKTTTKK